MERESALERNILLALILSVVVIVIALLVVFILFPPQPEVIPSIVANTERSGNTVYIYHDGGDPLQERTTRITINGQEIPNNAITFLHGQAWPWTSGETIRIQYPGPGSPDIIQIQYVSGDTSVIVYTPADTGSAFEIGRITSGSYADGVMDEVLFAQRYLRDEEVKMVYNRGLNGKEITSSELLESIAKIAGVSFANVGKVAGVAKGVIGKVSGAL